MTSNLDEELRDQFNHSFRSTTQCFTSRSQISILIKSAERTWMTREICRSAANYQQWAKHIQYHAWLNAWETLWMHPLYYSQFYLELLQSLHTLYSWSIQYVRNYQNNVLYRKILFTSISSHGTIFPHSPQLIEFVLLCTTSWLR